MIKPSCVSCIANNRGCDVSCWFLFSSKSDPLQCEEVKITVLFILRSVFETVPQGAQAPEATGGPTRDGDEEDPGPGGCPQVPVLRDPGAGEVELE